MGGEGEREGDKKYRGEVCSRPRVWEAVRPPSNKQSVLAGFSESAYEVKSTRRVKSARDKSTGCARSLDSRKGAGKIGNLCARTRRGSVRWRVARKWRGR